MFPIVERGGLHRTKKDIIIKVMRAPLLFKRSYRRTYVTVEGKNYRELVITTKIHQRKRGRGNKRTDRTPLLIYHLSKMSFTDTMTYYGFQPGEITVIGECVPTEGYSHIALSDNVHLKIANTAFDNLYKRRVIASYLVCLEEYPKFSIRDLLNPNPIYYKTVLGKFTCPANTNGQLLYDNAEKHLATTDSLLDPPTQSQLASIGVIANNIYELMHVVFFNIDRWITNYDPTDLSLKKIGALDQIMSGVVTNINSKQFKVVNRKNAALSPEDVRKIITGSSQYESWLVGNICFRANPTCCNDNYLFSVGTKRFRSLANTETKTKATSTEKRKTGVPLAMLKAHYSNLTVESVCSLPPSSPIVTGEINPYLEICLSTGNILPQKYDYLLVNVFN
jgi:hypothetical protein